MTFLPEVCGHILKKKAMDSRESLHVASLGNANFSAVMSNADSLEKETVCSGQALDPLKPGNI